jgi:hypothetical protein
MADILQNSRVRVGLFAALGLLLGAAAYAAPPAAIHCDLHRSAQVWNGACPGLLGGKPTLSLSTATSLKSGRYRKDADPLAIYSGEMRGSANAVFVELEIYPGGSGILRPEGLTWLVVANAVTTPARVSFDVDADKTVPPSNLDRDIIVRASSILTSAAVWDRADDRQCGADDRTWSIYCAMIRATLEVTGGIHHRRPAMEVVREVVDRRSAGRNYEHRLRDYNNDPRTTLADVRSLFEEALTRVASSSTDQLKRRGASWRPATIRSKSGRMNAARDGCPAATSGGVSC